MKILLLYITLAFFVSNVFSQHVDGDTFLPDMGVVIQPAAKLGKVEQPIIDETHIVKSKSIIDKKEHNFISIHILEYPIVIPVNNATIALLP